MTESETCTLGPVQPRRRFTAAVTALSASIFLPQVASAQTYPSKPITLICAHAPGGAADQLSRILSEALRSTLGQSVIVENRPGASTMLAAEQVARAAADGYTLLMATVTTLSINPSLYKRLRYDPLKDFAPVALVASTPFFLGVSASLPYQSARDLVRAAKEKPGSINYGSSGNGTSSHLAGALFNEMAEIDTVHIPYKATSNRNGDLAAGTIQAAFGNDLLPIAKSGRLRILGVTSDRRLSSYPEIPTVAEAAGLPGYEANVWYGLVAPAGTPAVIVAQLNAAVVKALAQDRVRQSIMTTLGGEVTPGTPEQFTKTIRSDLTKWARVIERTHIVVND